VFYTARSGWHSGAHSSPAFGEPSPIANLIVALIVIAFAVAILGAILSHPTRLQQPAGAFVRGEYSAGDWVPRAVVFSRSKHRSPK
jgi:hypothetical protein